MENRFGVKDFVLFILIAILIGLVALAMVQYDRQWKEIQAIRDKQDEQSRDLIDIQKRLARGVVVSNGGPATNPSTTSPTQITAEAQDGFGRLLAVRAKPDFAEGDAYVAGLSTLAKLTPLLSLDAGASGIQDNILESLCDRDPDTLEWRGHIARRWFTSADGLVLKFELRDDVTFSDGTPLTSDDVVFSFDLIMNEKVAAPRARAYYKTIKSVEKLDGATVVFTFKEPYFKAMEVAAGMSILPKHFYSQFSPEDFNKSTGLLMGSGPYRMPDPKSWKPGTPVQLVRNERYWGVRPAFDRLIYKEFSNDIARLTEFRNGGLDAFGAFPEQYVEMLKDEGLVKRTQHFEYQPPTGGYRYIAWNESRNGKPTFFADRRVRQALTMLIDRERLVQELMLGYGVLATGPFNAASKQYNPKVQPWSYDVARAKQLLAEAGYTAGDDGVLRSSDGQRFEFKLTYPSGNASYQNQALMIKDAYARAGIIATPDPLEWGTFTDRLKNKNFEAITLAWTSGIETDIYQIFHSEQMQAGGDDFISYKNEELDALITKARATVDESQRMLLWHRCHEILHNDQPYTFLFFPKALIFIDGRFANVHRTKLGLTPRDEWYVPRDKQHK